jgi:hypothetical protein
VIDDYRLVRESRISSQIVVSTGSSPPGTSPKAMSSLHAAGDPALLGDTRDRGEAHAGGATDDVEDRRHRIDPPDRSYV